MVAAVYSLGVYNGHQQGLQEGKAAFNGAPFNGAFKGPSNGLGVGP